MDWNKKGGITPMNLLIFFIFFSTFAIIGLGIFAYGMDKLEKGFSRVDLVINGVSFNETYNSSMYQAFETTKRNYDNMGIMIIMGMVLIMIAIGVFKKESRMWIIWDIFVILICFLISVYLSGGFNDYLTTLSELNTIHSNLLPKSSTLLLNLPYLVIIAGSIVGIVTYAITNKKEYQPKVFESF